MAAGLIANPRRDMPDMMTFPGGRRRDPAVERWLRSRQPRLRPLAATWFGHMRSCGPDVRELMHDGYATACVGEAAFAYVGVFTAHVNVGFFYGAELPDPAGLLEGTGKRMRHVKLRPDGGIDVQALDTLIDAAYRDVKRRLKTD